MNTICIIDEDGRDFHLWWANFNIFLWNLHRSSNFGNIREKELEKYNAAFDFNDRYNLVFGTEEELIRFVLEWS